MRELRSPQNIHWVPSWIRAYFCAPWKCRRVLSPHTILSSCQAACHGKKEHGRCACPYLTCLSPCGCAKIGLCRSSITQPSHGRNLWVIFFSLMSEGHFLHFNLLTEKQLRLACWETAAGSKNFSASAKGSTKTKGFVGSRGNLMTCVISASALGCQPGYGMVPVVESIGLNMQTSEIMQKRQFYTCFLVYDVPAQHSWPGSRETSLWPFTKGGS